ncbi:MAG: radical SAM protein [Candidatus Altiarchaeota archaeon]
MTGKEVLLVFPGAPERMPRAPFSVIVLASHIRRYGFKPRILDTRVDDYRNFDFTKYLAIGLSVKTGEQLSSAVKVAKHIRKKTTAPIIWGGPHPSTYPQQTCDSALADYVVIGEGEITFLELLRALEKDEKSPQVSDIAGLVHKKDGITARNGDRKFMDMEELDHPSYDLVDLKKYQDGLGMICVETSRGCPHRCSFCYVHDFHKRRWRKKSVKKVLGELHYIAAKYGVDSFFICDDNFFTDKKRVLEICTALIASGKGYKWFTQGRANYIASFTDEEMQTLKKAGLEFIAIGAESGSQRLLDYIKKDITVEEIINASRNCARAGIRPVLSFIVGIPNETEEDLRQTLDVYDRLKAISDDVEINGLYLFTTYPGTPIYQEAIKLGYREKQTLEEWAAWKFSHPSNLTWLSPRDRNRLFTISKIVLFQFLRDRFRSYGDEFRKQKIGRLKNLAWVVGSAILSWDASFRWRHRYFHLAPEWKLFGLVTDIMKVT